MRNCFVIARMNHETNTFSPVPTPPAAFRPLSGSEALFVARKSRTATAAFIAFAHSAGAEVNIPLWATANPSGPVSEEAFETMADEVVAAVRSGCDAILLDLHGAMVTERYDDGEGELLSRVRLVAPHVPIGVALDLHANVTPRMVANADVIVGFKTYPHIDMFETGEHVSAIIARILGQGLAPVRAWCRPPQLAHTLKMNTSVPGAMSDIIAAARAAETLPGVLAVSIFGGFPIADTPETGVSVVVVAETRSVAADVASQTGRDMWDRRADLVYHEVRLSDSISQAKAIGRQRGGGPVLLLDHGDNCMSGGTCDTMDVLLEVLAQGLDNILVGPICDPEAAAALTTVGLGAEITLSVGNKVPMPKIGVARDPVELTGTVDALSDGEYVITGPTYTGMRCSMGRTAVLQTGRARIVITERPHEPWDLGVFSTVGIDPRQSRFLVLKSRMYCRPVFEPLAKAVVECATRGVTSSDYSLFHFEKLKRPVYPLDPNMTWHRSSPFISDSATTVRTA
jgi:microcystin degradation protein MlrC